MAVLKIQGLSQALVSLCLHGGSRVSRGSGRVPGRARSGKVQKLRCVGLRKTFAGLKQRRGAGRPTTPNDPCKACTMQLLHPTGSKGTHPKKMFFTKHSHVADPPLTPYPGAQFVTGPVLHRCLH